MGHSHERLVILGIVAAVAAVIGGFLHTLLVRIGLDDLRAWGIGIGVSLLVPVLSLLWLLCASVIERWRDRPDKLDPDDK